MPVLAARLLPACSALLLLLATAPPWVDAAPVHLIGGEPGQPDPGLPTPPRLLSEAAQQSAATLSELLASVRQRATSVVGGFNLVLTTVADVIDPRTSTSNVLLIVVGGCLLAVACLGIGGMCWWAARAEYCPSCLKDSELIDVRGRAARPPLLPARHRAPLPALCCPPCY